MGQAKVRRSEFKVQDSLLWLGFVGLVSKEKAKPFSKFKHTLEATEFLFKMRTSGDFPGSPVA